MHVVGPPADELGELLAEWDLWMAAAGKSTRTRTERLATVRRLARRTGADVVTCDWKPLAQFIALHPGKGTRATYQGHLRAWYLWLALHGHRGDDPTLRLGKASPPKRKPRPLLEHEVATLLSTRMHRRTRAMILLARLQGMRVSEIACHRGEHIRGERIRIIGKGDRERVIKVHPIVVELAGRMPEIGPWFPSNSTRPGQHVTGHSVSSMLGEVIKRAGIAATPHQLRHTFATDLLRKCGNLRVVQEALGHADVGTTAIYTEVLDSEIAAAIDSMTLPLYVPR